MMRVLPMTAAREGDWTAFLLGHPDGLLYQSLPYCNLLVELLGCQAEYLLALDEADAVRGLLPLMWAADSDDRRVANALPWFGSIGAPLTDCDEAAAALSAAWDERATDPRTLSATMVANPLAVEEPRVAHGLTDERVALVTPLGADEEDLLAAIDPSARRNVRKAERAGFAVERDPNAFDSLRRIHEENMATIGGLAKTPEFFAAVPSHFEAGRDYDLWVARDGSEVAAALLVFHFGVTSEYFVPAIAHARRSDQPLAAILVRAMLAAAERGMQRWNWGGTWRSQVGVYRFKRKWGGVEHPYRYFTQLNDDALLDASPQELQARFPNFFVVPFSALRTAGAAT